MTVLFLLFLKSCADFREKSVQASPSAFVPVHVPNSMLNEHFTWPVRDMNGVYIHCTCVLYSGPLMPLHTPYWYLIF